MNTPTIPGSFVVQQNDPPGCIHILGPAPQNRLIARIEEGTLEDAHILAAARDMLAALKLTSEYGIKGKTPDGRWTFEHVRDAITKATHRP